MRFDIICVGVISLDTTLIVPFIPKVDSECFASSLYEAHGGAGGNVAAYASFYGGLDVGLIARTGDDTQSDQLIERLREYGVDTAGVKKTRNSPPTRIITTLLENGSKSYMLYLGPHSELTPNDPPLEYYRNCNNIYIAPCDPSVHKKFVDFAANRNMNIFFNPGSVYFEQGDKFLLNELIKKTFAVFLNHTEAKEYTNEIDTESAGKKLLDLGPEIVAITSNIDGSKVFSKTESEPISVPSIHADYVTSVGAGDGFAAGFISKYIALNDIMAASIFGSQLGAFSVTKHELRSPNPAISSLDDFIFGIINN